MKVNIGPYPEWVGPYQLAEKILFWIKKCDENYNHSPAYTKYVDGLGEFFSKITPLCSLLHWIYSKNKRKMEVHVDAYDVWNAGDTIAFVVLPILKKLKEIKHGSPKVDDEDVPFYLRSTMYPACENWETDKNWHNRWDYVIDEMIWAFEQKQPDNDWEDRYHHGNIDFKFVKCNDGSGCSEMVDGPNHTHWMDMDGMKKHQEKIDNGLRLFAKYYNGLWD